GTDAHRRVRCCRRMRAGSPATAPAPAAQMIGGQPIWPRRTISFSRKSRMPSMKGLILRVPDEELARRRQTGIDRYDEMWEGVLHMAPAPAFEHQRIVSALDRFLGPLCERSERGVLALGINVFGDATTTQDYRIPDLTFV